MPTWDSSQYLKFASERTQPAIDLVGRIKLEQPARIVDLGSGPGNSAAVLAQRWPAAEITGVDNAASMIGAAQHNFPQWTWIAEDIARWTAATPFDLVFSNAALQWVPDHARVLPHLFAQVAPGGALAFQTPANFDGPGHRLIRELAASAAWRGFFSTPVREWHSEAPSFYYDVLAALTDRVELWVTEYLHILSGPAEIVEWYRGSGLRPWLDALPDAPARTQFLADYLSAVSDAFPSQRNGRVLFPFRRLFAIAYR